MRKMYFAMIPKRSFVESAAIAVGVGAGLIYGAKWLVGDEKFNEYTSLLKNKIFNSNAPEFTAQGPDTGVGIGDEDARAKEEENILERIRKAAASKL